MRQMSKGFWAWTGALSLSALAAAAYFQVSSALRVAAGSAAHNLCSSLFVSGLPVRQTQDEWVDVLIGPAGRWLHLRVGRAEHRVETRV